jgi:hypothetical protein
MGREKEEKDEMKEEMTTSQDFKTGRNTPPPAPKLPAPSSTRKPQLPTPKPHKPNPMGYGIKGNTIRAEEVEQIDEIAPWAAGALALGAGALGLAAIKRAQDAAKSGVDAARRGQQVRPGTGIGNATYGMQRRNDALRDAMKQLNQSYEPEGEQIDEKKLTEPEMKKREEVVKSMKNRAGDFEKRYPGRGKEVMYATATKMAKKVAEGLDPVGQEDSDIDNDGDTDTSDKYLGKRRAAIKKAIQKKRMKEGFSNWRNDISFGEEVKK